MHSNLTPAMCKTMAGLVCRISQCRCPLIAAAAARFPGLVPCHFVDQGSGYTTGGVSDTTQPAAMHAAARNLDSVSSRL
jgi:hypothetical protein